MSLSVDEKIRVAHALDDLGVHFIEAGFPASNPKEAALFDLLSGESFSTSAIAAFGMTRRRDRTAEQDEGLRALAESFAPVCTLVGKTWSLHLEKVTQVDPEENLRMTADSVGFLAGQGKRVIYDAEHFFDAFRDDQEYAIRCLRAAAEAGAENVTLCDTNGSSLPAQVSAATSRVAVELGDSVQVGIHTHDDAGCGVALGTDFNPGTSPTPSLPLAMSLACLNLGMTPDEVLAAVTINAAHAVGLGDEVGSLEVGKAADLVIWNVPTSRQIPYWPAADLVRTVVKRGRVVLDEG